tara:strand:- start:7292 stop:7549 length:258 start_codon:yes stop_codon:yes gene_type:complete
MSKTIPWKKHDIHMEFNGQRVHAEITWWAKDYYIDIKSPIQKRISGPHMMYMIPAKFVIEKNPKDDMHQVPILGTCKSMILRAMS